MTGSLSYLKSSWLRLACVLAVAFLFPFFSLSPVQAQDRAAGAVSKFDRNGDGKVSRKEWKKPGGAFKKIDGNGDGSLTVEEFRAFFGGGAPKSPARKEGSSQKPVAEKQETKPAQKTGKLPKLYFVDAHSQMAAGLDPEIIIPLMDKAGVWHTILSARNDRSPEDVAEFAAQHPKRITGAVRSKGRGFNANKPKFKTLLENQLSQPAFKAMAEAILYHAKKGNKAPEISVAIDSPQSKMLLQAAKKRGWPYIAHYEFAGAGWSKDKLMEQFEDTARNNPEHPFALIHMGQLGAKDAKRLIEGHPNVYFITSHSNPVNNAKHHKIPWANLFDGARFKQEWLDLFIAHPDRFILAFDNVFPDFWGAFYLDQVAVWRKAMAHIPPDVAAAIAHGNAERLWKLPVPPKR